MQPRLVIDDPLMVNNNVGKSAFRFHEIKVSAVSQADRPVPS